jgi:mono/diheme cytochrome c family protein
MNLVLAVLLVFVTALGWWLNTSTDRPHYEILPDMKYSPAYGAFSPSPHLANGQTLQNPIPGTIARDELPLHYENTPADALRAGEELENPTAATDAAQSVDRGASVYRAFCVACHGNEGHGDGLVAKRGFPPPPSLLTGKSTEMKDGQLFHIVTFGQANMPSLAAQVTPTERWDVINYVRRLQHADGANRRGQSAD